jgi:hypothetical protein
MNIAVNMLGPSCNVTLIGAVLPLMTATIKWAVPPVNLIMPVAVVGATFAVRVISFPATSLVTDGVSVTAVGVVG